MVTIRKKNRVQESWGSRLFDVCNVIVMLLLSLAVLFPIWHVLVVSFSDGIAVQSGQVVFWPKGFTVASYAQIFKEKSLLNAYGNTLKYTLVGTAINMAMTILCAYPMSKRELFGKGFFTVLMVIPMFVGGGMIPTYLLIDSLGLIDTMWAIVLPGAISTYNMIVMRTFFQTIPTALEESAKIEGAGEWRVLLSVVLPLSTPILATMIMFYSVGHWNSYFSAILYLNRKEYYPVQVILRNIVIANETQNYIAETASSSMEFISTTIKYAVVVVVIAPILCIYPFVQKYFVKGMMVGAIKG